MSNSFSREEIAKIMSKATQIQAQMDKYGEHETLSQEELFELGSEVGVSQSAIIEAMNEVNTVAKKRSRFSWIRGTSSIQETQLLPGELTEEEWDAVVAEIRASTGGIGKLIRTNSTFEWEQRRAEVGYRHFTFIPGKNSTKFTFNYNWIGLNVLLSAVSTVLTMALAVILGKTLLGNEYKGFSALLGLITGFVGGRMYLYSYFKDQRQKLNDLTKSISGILRRRGKKNQRLDEIDILDEANTSDKSNVRSKEAN